TLLPLLLLISVIFGSLISLLIQLDYATLLILLVEPEIHFAVMLSLITSLIALLLAIVIGIPAAWSLVRYTLPARRIFDLLIDLPMVMPPLVVGIGLLLLLGHHGFIGQLFPSFASALFSPVGVIIAQCYVATAIIVRHASAAFKSLDTAYLTTAYNLGLSPLKTCLLVEIPLIWRLLLSSCVLALARALGEFGATLMLAGTIRLKTETLPMAIYL